MQNKLFVRAFLAAVLGMVGLNQGEEFVPGNRQPQWPLKTSRVLLNDDQIANARRLCDTDENAKSVRDRIIEDCEYWLAMPDKQLHDLLPDYRVPRAFDISTEGCPVHGKAIYRTGAYPWKFDREHPFTLICPVGGERYPSNDFGAYYRSGLTDSSLLTGPYADAGRGWVGPNGVKYWMVAHACHLHWQRIWLPAMTSLSQAYVLTGDQRYAHKAVVILDRIAEVYPGMDHAKQSRYGELKEGKYYGKIVNYIWETGVLKSVASAYDMVFPALVGENAISLDWRSSERIRANIEANLLEEGLDCIDKKWIFGNYGTHQNALIYTVLVRQNGPTSVLLRGVFEKSGKELRDEGINYAFYNLIYKDGIPYETSPSYGSMWLDCFESMAGPLAKSGFDINTQPKMKRILDAPLELVCAGQFTPAIGDAGSISSGWIVPGAKVYEAAYRHYREPRFAWALSRTTRLREDKITSFDDLFKELVISSAMADAKRYHHQPRSRLLDGFGLAVLNNPQDSMAVSMYYGEHNVHAHRDRLNIELFGYGRRLSPDLGYPDQTDNFHPGIFSWSQNTVSHNCLVVDQSMQKGVATGKVLRFHDSPTVHVVDADGTGTYEQADVYRRTLVQVDTSEHHSYLVDVMRVRGGKDHCLSMHGAEGEFTWQGCELPPPVTQGTLAGANVSIGELYDDPVLGAPGYKGGYADYKGSGFSHLFNWQRVAPKQVCVGQWKLKGEPAAGLRVHISPCRGQELVVADAYVSPKKRVPTVLKYVLAQRSASGKGNTFITVWEPYQVKPIIDSVEIIGSDALADCDADATVVVKRGNVVDAISIAASDGHMRVVGPQVESDAAVTVVSWLDDTLTRTFAAGGMKLISDGKDITRIKPSLSGRVRAADYLARTVTIEPRLPIADVSELVGHNVRLFNERHSCTYPIAAARMKDGLVILELGGPEPITGRILVTSINQAENTIITSSFRPCPGSVGGMHLASSDYRITAKIASLRGRTYQLGSSDDIKRIAQTIKRGTSDDLWIVDFGAGDDAEVEVFTHETSSK